MGGYGGGALEGGCAVDDGVDLMAAILPGNSRSLKTLCMSFSQFGLDAVGDALMALNLGTLLGNPFVGGAGGWLDQSGCS